MDNNEAEIIQRFRTYASSGIALPPTIQPAKSSSTSLNTTKYTRQRPPQTIEKNGGLAIALFVVDNALEVGGNFDRREVYKIPSGYEIVYKTINKTGIGIDDWLINLILRETNTDNYKFLVVTEVTVLEKDIALPFRTDDLYDFKRLSEIIFQHGFFTGYDVSLLKEEYTETSTEILSHYMENLGYGLLVYRDGHIVNETPIMLQTFDTPTLPDEGLDGDLIPTRTLPPVLTIDDEDFTVTKTESYVSGKLKTTITKTVGSVNTVVWEYTEPEIIPSEYEPEYTYTVVRNPPFTDSREEPQCALSGFQFDTLIVTGTREVYTGVQESYGVVNYIYPPVGLEKIPSIPYIEITTNSLPLTGGRTTHFQTNYTVWIDMLPPYDNNIGGFILKQSVASAFTITSEFSSSGIFITNGSTITDISYFDCYKPIRIAEPYTGSRRIESYSGDFIRDEDIIVGDPLYNSFTNDSLPDIDIVVSTEDPIGNYIKDCTITPIYTSTVPITLPDTIIDINLRNKDNYVVTNDYSYPDNLISFGYPQAIVVKNGSWLWGDDGTPAEGGAVVVEGGDTIYIHEPNSNLYRFTEVTHDLTREERLSLGWDLGFIAKSKEFQTDLSTIVCVGDLYSLVKEFDINNTITLENYNTTEGLFIITGNFRFAEKYQFIAGTGIKPNTQIISSSYTQITLTDSLLITGVTDIVLRGESIYKIQNRVYTRRDLFTPIDLYPENDPRNNSFVLDIGLGKPNLIGTTLYIITKINEGETAEGLAVNLFDVTPSFSTFETKFIVDSNFVDISVIE